MIGSTIAHYRVTGKLGEGGMGVVYRAVDTRLEREVAIKVLPADVAQEPDRLARFEREAKTLASLNHPNIAAIYGVEESALVMELVEGPTLADRLRDGAIPVDEAIEIAKQIADALEAAHEKGVVHRDLKPANVKVTPNNVVKLLDFGLAKAMESSKQALDPVNSPTVVAGTIAGMIMGTAGYMAPEQAKGQAVDRRADIWAFGVVFYEMLTGRQLFDSGSVAEAIADILRADIDLNKLPANTPGAVRNLLRRCLERNARLRLRDIGEARILLSEPIPSVEPVAAVAAAPARMARWPFALAAVLALGIPVAWLMKPVPELPLLQMEVVPPLGVALGPVMWAQLQVSPDGRMIVYSGRDRDGKDRLYLRSFSEGTTIVVPNSEGAKAPFWSPDNRNVGFHANGKLKHVELASGKVLELTDVPGAMGSWSADGTILFSPGKPLQKVSASGGKVENALPPETLWTPGSGMPWFLPDGRSFLYFVSGSRKLMLSTIDGRIQPLLDGIAIGATYTPNPAGGGWLLYQAAFSRLSARPFDYRSGKITGDEKLIVQDVPGGPSWSSSNNGVLAYRSSRGSGDDRTMTWVERNGARVEAIAGPGNVYIPRIAPDQRSVVYTQNSGSQPGVFEYDIERKATTKIADRCGYAGWTPDGKSLIYTTSDRMNSRLVEHSVKGASAPKPLTKGSTDVLRTTGVSPDGKWIASAKIGGAETHTMFVSRSGGQIIPLDSDQAPLTHHASFSPDGSRILLSRLVNGRWEVFVQALPQALGGPSGGPMQWQVSTTGGTQPKWREDGKEIFYIAPDGSMMVVPVVSTTDTFRVGAATALFATNLGLQTGYQREYDVTADGKRFILPLPPTGPHQEAPITVIFNWPQLMKSK